MLSSINWPSLDSFLGGNVTFGDVGEIFTGLYESAFKHENFMSLWGGVQNFLDNAGVFVAIGLLLLSVVELCFGKKLLTLQKFLLFFGIGFASGVSLIAPLLADAGMELAPWIVGLIVGVVAALFSRLLYLAVYIAAVGYSTYMIFMGGQLLPDSLTSFTKGNMIISLVVVAVVILLAMLFRKWIEILGTSVLGGYFVALSVEKLVLELAKLELNSIAFLIIFAVTALVGCVIQVKTRSRRRF